MTETEQILLDTLKALEVQFNKAMNALESTTQALDALDKRVTQLEQERQLTIDLERQVIDLEQQLSDLNKRLTNSGTYFQNFKRLLGVE